MNDKEVIQQIRSGDQKAVGFVYSKFKSKFLKWSLRNFKCDENMAEDVYTESVISCYENIINGKLHEDNLSASFQTYLFSVAKYKFFSVLKEDAKKSDLEKTINEYSGDTLDLTEDLELLDDEGQVEALQKSLIELGKPCSTVLTAYYYHKKRMKVIAEEYGYKNESVAKNQKFKCLKRLRKIYHTIHKNVS